MKKIKLFLLCYTCLFFSPFQNIIYGASIPLPRENEAPLFSMNYQLKISEFIKLTPKKLYLLTMKKMTFLEKISLKIQQIEMRCYLKNHPDLFVTDYKKAGSKKKKLSLLWFSIGLLVPLVGILLISSGRGGINVPLTIAFTITPILIAYLTKRSKIEKRSVWTGVAIVVILGLFLAALGASAGAFI